MYRNANEENDHIISSCNMYSGGAEEVMTWTKVELETEENWILVMRTECKLWKETEGEKRLENLHHDHHHIPSSYPIIISEIHVQNGKERFHLSKIDTHTTHNPHAIPPNDPFSRNCNHHSLTWGWMIVMWGECCSSSSIPNGCMDVIWIRNFENWLGFAGNGALCIHCYITWLVVHTMHHVSKCSKNGDDH